MRTGALTALLPLLAFAASCGDDAPAFLPLDQLCSAISEDVCDAPKGCCKVLNDGDECLERVNTICEQERAELVKENALSYDGVEAARVRSAQQADVAECRAATAIAGFFEGGLTSGTACERDAQCASGACEGKCVEGSGPALCNDTEGLAAIAD